ncbi:V-type proton ATPase subunit S1 [Diabrotica virgifera virgifera]|uniref:V-type proton ATPase subunit S1 n=1 Tax=Diabrotica virgifera virgifera TaxID=50390 RepID=A0A6P7GYA8_DIAVI|nr:V-type proton ATPase subunit S1 [Diabrotica virgifera virgifera]
MKCQLSKIKRRPSPSHLIVKCWAAPNFHVINSSCPLFTVITRNFPKMSASKSGLFFLATFFLFSLVQSTEFVPCFIWSNKRTNEHIPALNKVSQDIFKENIEQYLKDDPLIVLFAEQTLSPEDFAQKDERGLTYSNLAKLTKSFKVSYLPYVQNPIKALKHLDVTVTEVPLDKFGKNFEIPETDILIVNLNDAKDSESRTDMLKRHDAAISKIYEDLANTNDNVLGMYTAHHTSWVVSEEVIKSRQARSLMVAENAEAAKAGETAEEVSDKFRNDTNAYLYISNSAYTMGDVQNKEVNLNLTVTNDTGILVLNLGCPDFNLEMKFANNVSFGYWEQYENITAFLSNDTQKKNPLVLKSTASIYAPVSGFSYHCGDQYFSTDGFSIKLQDFQIQLFFDGPASGKFGDAYDCVGFTTVPIWSGLFVTTILLIIMSIGITMMMDIRTMDRFDDAKGKTITINAE